jgi:large subunit ribosomal protein L35
MPWRLEMLSDARLIRATDQDFEEWSKMPKLKSKSGAKKRFRLTATGKVRANQAGKQHGMIKRTNKQIRNQRGTTILSPQDAKIVKQFLNG